MKTMKTVALTVLFVVACTLTIVVFALFLCISQLTMRNIALEWNIPNVYEGESLFEYLDYVIRYFSLYVLSSIAVLVCVRAMVTGKRRFYTQGVIVFIFALCVFGLEGLYEMKYYTAYVLSQGGHDSLNAQLLGRYITASGAFFGVGFGMAAFIVMGLLRRRPLQG